MRKSLTYGVAAVAAAGAILTCGTASAAVSGHPITGTCYENGSWFSSSNIRTMAGTSIKANFSTLPSKGLAFHVINYNTGGALGSIIYAPPTGTQTMYSGTGGKQFYNQFRLEVSGHQDNYSFDGSEIY